MLCTRCCCCHHPAACSSAAHLEERVLLHLWDQLFDVLQCEPRLYLHTEEKPHCQHTTHRGLGFLGLHCTLVGGSTIRTSAQVRGREEKETGRKIQGGNRNTGRDYPSFSNVGRGKGGAYGNSGSEGEEQGCSLDLRPQRKLRQGSGVSRVMKRLKTMQLTCT